MLKAVIFDMDGVLVDSEPLHAQAERETFAPFGIDVSDEELQRYIGRTSRFLIRDFIDRYRLDVREEDLYRRHRTNLRTLYERVAPIPGALELLREIGASDVKIGLASSTDLDLIRIAVERLAVASFFHALVSGQEVERPKPDPDIFLETARRMGCDPSECVVIEDSRAGVEGAKRAGMACAAFESPHSLNQDVSVADLVIDDLRKLDLERLRSLVAEG